MNKAKIVLVGGGSVAWSPRLINDILFIDKLHNSEFVILDIDEIAGRKMVELGNKLCKDKAIDATFEYTNSQDEAFLNCDFVIITISTGDLDAMENDIIIPEDYKIYQTVGDTVGPGGWARSLRNSIVFEEMAQNIERLSPNAVILNYTNPMATLTNIFYKKTKLRTVGLCHGLFECYDYFQKIFDVTEEDIKINFAGTNHFFWLLDIKIKGEDGYEMLKEKTKKIPFAELLKDTYVDNAGFSSNHHLAGELYETFGYVPYVGDRHISEFLPYCLTGSEQNLKSWNLVRTSVETRRDWKKINRERLDNYIDGSVKLPDKPSRETAANIINSIVSNKEFIDVINVPNRGQVANLPQGSIVETLGIINTLGFTPITAGDLPQELLNMVLPHCVNQDLLVDAGLEGDLDKAFLALYNDPMCSHLSYKEIKEMGMKLINIQKRFMPQFKL